MTREDHLKFCKICIHQKFDYNQGIICSLTQAPADFDPSCETFVEDTALRQRMEKKVISNAVQDNLAEGGLRFANYIIDLIVLLGLGFGIGIILGVVLLAVSPESLSILEEDSWIMNRIFGFFVGMLYYGMVEGLSGRTVGKLITNTKVVTEDGEKPDFGTILIRSVCRFIPFEAFSFLGTNAIGWHDSLSKTRVVKINKK